MSKQCAIFSLFLCFIFYDELIAADPICGDWEAFEDEKCFKIIDETLRTYDDAEKSCGQAESGSTLPIIRSKEEQDFLTNYVFKIQNKVDNCWIGAKFSTNKFKWIDESDLSFTNWQTGSPRNRTNYCVQMQSDVNLVGKWIDEPCDKKNLVVCEKSQTWTLTRLQKTLLDTRKELKDSLERIEKSPFPIGFIYAQLPNEKSPVEIWPWMTWTDASSSYAGVFFRVLGGEAASFGQVQEDNAPRLVEFTSDRCSNIDTRGETKAPWNMNIPKGNWSIWGVTGTSNSDSCAYNVYSKSRVSSGEVRPRNMAIRLWRRAA